MPSYTIEESTEATPKMQMTPVEVSKKEGSMDGYLYLDDDYYDEINGRQMIVRGQALDCQSLLEEKPSTFRDNY